MLVGGASFGATEQSNPRISLFQRIKIWFQTHLGKKEAQSSFSRFAPAGNLGQNREMGKGYGEQGKGKAFGNSAEMKARQQEMLTKFDADGDGKLSETEMAAARAARDQEMLTKYDADGDGVLSDAEKATMKAEMPQPPQDKRFRPGGQRGNASGTPPLPQEVVTKFDADGDGKLSETEMAAARAARDQEMLTKYDADGDGVLSDAEKATMKAEMPQPPQDKRFRPGGQRGNASGTPPLPQEVVTKFDADGDGKLSETEMAAARAARDQERLTKYDADGDGVLSDTEKAAKKAEREAEMISKFDTDGDGTLSETEKEAMPNHGRKGPPPEGRKMSAEQIAERKAALVKMYDKDGNGTLDDSEKTAIKGSFQKYFHDFFPEDGEN
jgi:Ca2+-binding EF-hand superfamily protein